MKKKYDKRIRFIINLLYPTFTGFGVFWLFVLNDNNVFLSIFMGMFISSAVGAIYFKYD